MTKNLKKIGKGFLIFLIWCLIWYLLSLIIGNALLFPNPIKIVKAIGNLCMDKEFYITILNSFFNIVIGILIAILFAVFLTFLTGNFSMARDFISPAMAVIRATPVASFIILFLVFFNNKYVPSIITFLMVLPIVWGNLDVGIKNIDKELDEVTKVYKFSYGKRMLYLVLPSIKPYFLSACKTSIGIGWKAGVAAEVIARSARTIGYAISESKQYSETENVFAWTIIVILLSVLVETILNYLFKKFTKKEGDKKHA